MKYVKPKAKYVEMPEDILTFSIAEIGDHFIETPNMWWGGND